MWSCTYFKSEIKINQSPIYLLSSFKNWMFAKVLYILTKIDKKKSKTKQRKTQKYYTDNTSKSIRNWLETIEKRCVLKETFVESQN